MPVDRPDPEAALSAAEAAHLAARDTVPVDTGSRDTGSRDTGSRDTVRLDVRPDPLAARPTVRLPAQRTARPRRRAPLFLAAAVATIWAALISYAPVAVVLGLARLAEGAPVPGAARLGLAGWLLGHGVALETDAGPLGLVPLGLSTLAAWRLIRAGIHTIRGIGARHTGSPARALAGAAAIGVTYGLLGAGAALVVGGVSAPRAGATLAAFGFLAGLVGTARASGALGAVAARTHPVLRDGVRTGVVVALLLTAAGALAAGVSIALGGGEASEVLAAYRTGVAGQAGVTLICLAYAPNAAVWAAAYLVGPGFALGTDSVVRVTEVSVGGLPALPIFAGLPAGPVGGAGAALVGVPVVAGMVGGWLLARRRMRRPGAGSGPASGSLGESRHVGESRQGSGLPRRPARSGGSARPVRWPGLLGAAALAGPVAGGLLGLLAAVSGGPLGAGRLAEIGPDAVQVAGVGTLVTALGAVVGAAAGRTFLGAREH